jgi:endonuclease YncB( thermonuclease family)
MEKIMKKRSDYRKLILDLKDLIEKGRQKAVQAVSWIGVETNWHVGQRLSRVDEIQERTTSAQFIQRLAGDLEVDPSILYRTLQFFRAWPEGLPNDPGFRRLSWGMHVALLPVKDPAARDYYVREAAEKKWSREALRRAIRGDLFSSRETSKGASGAVLNRPVSGLHTYTAVLERVVDGDTLLVRIDLGFDVWRVERIRLRGVDTPELKHKAGREAKQFVEKSLAGAPFLVLRTYKTDRYARYVADVFYHQKMKKKSRVFEEGYFLNQVLLDTGHARWFPKS